MANDLTQNPIKIDTAGSSVLTTKKLYPMSIRWVGAATAGHAASITDQNDKVVWSGVAAVGPNNVEAEQINVRKPWNGLKVPTLASGVLWITLKHNPPYV